MNLSCMSLFLAVALMAEVASAQDVRAPKVIYDQIKAAESIEGIKMQQSLQKGELPLFKPCDSDCKKKFADQDELEQRASKDPIAAFYRGLLAMESAQLAQRVDAPKQHVEDASRKAREMFELASRGGIAAASWNIAQIYATSLGVIGSNLAAIEWYSRAGHQFFSAGERESALAALERIEKMDARHPESRRLRSVLFKSK